MLSIKFVLGLKNDLTPRLNGIATGLGHGRRFIRIGNLPALVRDIWTVSRRFTHDAALTLITVFISSSSSSFNVLDVAIAGAVCSHFQLAVEAELAVVLVCRSHRVGQPLWYVTSALFYTFTIC